MSRRILFILSIVVGVAVGLIYGWVINPVHTLDTSPDTLRTDYKTDYVLMVAEAYHTGNDLTLAASQLALLGSASPSDTVQQAIVLAGQAGYATRDIDLMVTLAQALQTQPPRVQGTP